MSWPSSSPMPSSAPTTSPAAAIRRHTPDDSPTRSKSSASRSRSHPRPPDPADPHTAAQPRNCPLSRNSDSRVRGVELRGLEPLTPTLPVWCATSCATAPYRPGLVRPSREQLYRAAEPEPRGGGDAPRHLATGAPPPSGRRDESSDEGSGEGSGEGSALFHLRDAD